MIDAELLTILCCPETRQSLEWADAPLIAEINRKIAGGQASNRGGKTVTEPIENGLLRSDRTVLYPVRDGIPVLLVEEGILL